jgi:hypothetical protein
MKKIIVSGLLLFIVPDLTAQSAFKRNSLYIEIAGNGGVLSLNYERQLSSAPGWGIFIGAGPGDSKPTIPLGVRYLFPLKSTKSFIEAGAGVTLASKSFWDAPFGENSPTPFKPG